MPKAKDPNQNEKQLPERSWHFDDETEEYEAEQYALSVENDELATDLYDPFLDINVPDNALEQARADSFFGTLHAEDRLHSKPGGEGEGPDNE